MADVQALTDDELRTKLVEYGFPVMPITGTTRNLMTKKLKLLMESKGKGSSDRRSLGKFSSDEESDADAKVVKKDKNRRVTMAVTPMQQSKTTINVEEKREMEPPAPVQKEKRKSSARSTTKIILQVKESPDTTTDSEPEIDEYKKSYKIEVLPPKEKASPIKEKVDLPPPMAKPRGVESITSRTTTSTSASRYTTYAKPSDVSEKLENIRSRLSLGARKDYFAEPTLPPSDNDDEETPFLSNFTRRLSQMSPRNGASVGLSEGGDYDDATSTLYSRSNYSSRPRGRDYSKSAYASTSEAEPTKSSSSNVPFILFAGVALFFVVLAALYYGMHSGNNAGAIMGKTNKYEPHDLL